MSRPTAARKEMDSLGEVDHDPGGWLCELMTPAITAAASDYGCCAPRPTISHREQPGTRPCNSGRHRVATTAKAGAVSLLV